MHYIHCKSVKTVIRFAQLRFMIPRLTMKTFFKILFAPLLWLVHACSPLGNPVDEEKSDNHYYNKKKTDIRYSRMGNWFELGNSPMNADVESFEVLNRNFAKDKDHVYYEANAIEKGGVDLASFHIKDNEYMSWVGFDKNHAYTFEKVYGKSKKGVKAFIIEGADPKAYTHTDWDWANDGKNHFYRFKIIPADYETFEIINESFSKDKNTIFHQSTYDLTALPADLASFETLGEGPLAKDKSNVYCVSYKSSSKNKLVTIPIYSGETIENLNDIYLKIGKSIYHWGELIEEIDAESFEIVSYHYGKDKNHVFYQGRIVQDADLATFGLIKESGIGDKNGRFREGERIGK